MRSNANVADGGIRKGTRSDEIRPIILSAGRARTPLRAIKGGRCFPIRKTPFRPAHSLGIVAVPCNDGQMAILRGEFDLVIRSIGIRSRRRIADIVLIAKCVLNL